MGGGRFIPFDPFNNHKTEICPFPVKRQSALRMWLQHISGCVSKTRALGLCGVYSVDEEDTFNFCAGQQEASSISGIKYSILWYSMWLPKFARMTSRPAMPLEITYNTLVVSCPWQSALWLHFVCTTQSGFFSFRYISCKYQKETTEKCLCGSTIRFTYSCPFSWWWRYFCWCMRMEMGG